MATLSLLTARIPFLFLLCLIPRCTIIFTFVFLSAFTSLLSIRFPARRFPHPSKRSSFFTFFPFAFLAPPYPLLQSIGPLPNHDSPLPLPTFSSTIPLLGRFLHNILFAFQSSPYRNSPFDSRTLNKLNPTGLL